MAGVGITGKIKPLNSGNFPVFEDINGQGGLRTVATIAERDTLLTNAALFGKPGMLVFVTAVQCYYELSPDLAAWIFYAPSPALASQADWYVDPATGNDNNTGLVGSPLATVHELQRRICPYGGQTLLTRDVTVHLATATYLGVEISVGSADEVQRTLTIECAVTSSAPITLSAVTQPLASTKTRGQLTTLSGTFVAGERVRLTSGTHVGAIAYSTGLNANAQDTFASLFVQPTFAAFHNPAPAASGDTCVIDTLTVIIRRLQVTAGVNSRIVVKDAQLIRAAVSGVAEGGVSADAGGNVLFSGCNAVSTAGFWECNTGGACLFGCRWTANTRTGLKGYGWLNWSSVVQGVLAGTEGSIHSYGLTLDGGQVVLGSEGDPNGSPNNSAFEFIANRSYVSAGAIEAENGGAHSTYRGAAFYIGNGSKLTVGDFTECELWGASAAYAIGFYVEAGAHIYSPGSLLATLAIPSTINFNVGGIDFAYSDNPIMISNANCGVMFIPASDTARSKTDANIYRTAQSGNQAAASFPNFIPQAGMYQVSGYVATTTADAGAAGAPILNVIFTDDSGVQRTVSVATPPSVTALGGAGGLVVIESNGAAIQWSVSGVVTPGTAQYSARCRVEKLSSGA